MYNMMALYKHDFRKKYFAKNIIVRIIVKLNKYF